MGRDFYDLDQTIQDKVGKSVQNIYIYDGKDAFSEYEYSTIKELIHNKPSVIATGGGTVTYDKTVKLMRNNGLVNVYEERYPLYEEVAHIKIGNEGSITDAVQEIIEALPNTEK
ncbi:MAG: shikimate kinase [Veillonella sp.]|nr:shikimate kinase [Veillonella sp.]